MGGEVGPEKPELLGGRNSEQTAERKLHRTLAARLHAFARCVFGSPVHDRLVGEIKSVAADVAHDVLDQEGLQAPWLQSATKELNRARCHLERWEVENAWDAVHAAKRFQLSNPDKLDRLEREAVALRFEAEKVEGWRGKTILKLLDEPADPATGKRVPDRVLDALRHRDHASQNIWFKIMLRRRHLFSLFLMAWLLVALCVCFSLNGWLDPYLGSFKQVLMAVLFGAMGGVVGVARSLVADNVSARIPAQQIGAFVVWMRPGLGAAAALVVLALWKSNVDTKVLQFVAAQPPTAVGLAFLAGFSEQFLVGTLSRLPQDAGFRESKARRDA